MAWLRGIILSCLLFATFPVAAQFQLTASYQSQTLDRILLKDIVTGKATNLTLNSSSKQLFLFVFLSPECPLCQQYSLPLKELSAGYRDNIDVIGIFPGKSYDRKTINLFLTKYNLRFPVYLDEKKKLTDMLSASVTPEVIMLSKDQEVMKVEYRGAIDDRVKSLSVKSLKASNYYLKDAIDQYLLKKDVVTKRTDPVGCLINDY